jgi:hypothetical protein
MAAHGEIGPMPDVAIFADTGAEPAAVYEQVRWLSSGNVLPFPVEVVKAGDIIADMRRQAEGVSAGAGGRSPSAPFFAPGRKQGSSSPIRRQCTGHYKIEPINAAVRAMLGFQPRQRIPVGSVEMRIGISTDEVVRAGAAHEAWIVNRHPLLERRMSRQDCSPWLLSRGYDVPVASACTFCPFRDDVEWGRLSREDPEAFAQAVEIDSLVRPGFVRSAAGTSTGRLFVHRSMRPLAEIDFSTAEERGQGMLRACDGGCGL